VFCLAYSLTQEITQKNVNKLSKIICFYTLIVCGSLLPKQNACMAGVQLKSDNKMQIRTQWQKGRSIEKKLYAILKSFNSICFALLETIWSRLSYIGIYFGHILHNCVAPVQGMLLNIYLTSRPPFVCQNPRSIACTLIKVTLAATRTEKIPYRKSGVTRFDHVDYKFSV
jgi:hypothetical protein